MSTQASESSGLSRSLGLALLVFYGLGIIIGAGVYVAVDDVVETAGSGAVLSFAIAGVLAAFTAISYAELAVRYPEAAGAAAYVKEAFGSDKLSRLTGLAVALVTLVTAATIARGTAGYAQAFVPLPDFVIAGFMVLLFTAIACLGVKDSVRAAAIMTVIELAGLIMVIGFGLSSIGSNPAGITPAQPYEWQNILAGAFLAFFAFTGFENLANMAEEAKDARRTVPTAILVSLGISTGLYLIIAAIVLAIRPSEEASALPALLAVFKDSGRSITAAFSLLALVAIANGVLIQILMLSRLFYGMARRSLLPNWLSRTNRLQVPIASTLLSGLLVLVFSLTLPFDSLLRLSTTLTLVIFALVSLSLFRIKSVSCAQDPAFMAPLWIPILSVCGNLLLILAQFI